MTFFNIVPRSIKTTHSALSLRVVQDRGFEVEPLINVNVTELNRNSSTNTLYQHFHVNGDGGIKFKVEVIIKKNDKWANKLVTYWLNIWYANLTRLYVITDAIDIKNGNYILTSNSSRKQNYNDTTIWELEFTSYNSLTVNKFKNNTKNIKKAIKRYTKAKNKAKKQAQNKKLNKKLSKCKVGNLKYKKKNNCCYYLNRKLVLKGYLSSKTWKVMKKKKKTKVFTGNTTKAVKKFQKKYNKKHKSKKLKVNGKMNKATLKALTKS